MSIKEKYNSLSESQKALTKMIGIVVAIILIFIFIILVMSIIKGGKKTNSQIEAIMEKAAQEYVANHDEVLKDQIYGSTEIEVDKLVEEKYMKPLTKYYGKDSTCKGKVLVYKNLDNYDYNARIDCGDNYKTASLYEKIVDKKNIVTEESGLYEYEDKYVYRGEYVDNYVSFAGSIWRIVNITKDGEIRMFQNTTDTQVSWDDRYNGDYKEKSGINLFEGTESSRLKESILGLYNNESIFTNEVKSHIIPKEYCSGKRSEDDTTKDYSTECSTKTELMGASALVAADFLNASIDPKCITTSSKECSNYNYMANLSRSSWLMTADSSSTKKAYYFADQIYSTTTVNYGYVRLVVTVNGNINYTKGTGTEEDPYVIG